MQKTLNTLNTLHLFEIRVIKTYGQKRDPKTFGGLHFGGMSLDDCIDSARASLRAQQYSQPLFAVVKAPRKKIDPAKVAYAELF